MPDRRGMESLLRGMAKTLAVEQFESIEQANKALQKKFGGRAPSIRRGRPRKRRWRRRRISSMRPSTRRRADSFNSFGRRWLSAATARTRTSSSPNERATPMKRSICTRRRWQPASARLEW
jgi:hypothetical protein